MALCHPVVELAGDPQALGEPLPGLVKVAGHQRGEALVQQHHAEAVQVAGLAAEPGALRGRGPDGAQIAVEEAIERPGLLHHERGSQVIEAVGGDLRLVEQPPGGCAITGHVRGDRGHGERFRKRPLMSGCPGRDYRVFQHRPCGHWIVLQHGEEATGEVCPWGRGRFGLPAEQLVEPPHALSRPASDPVPGQAGGENDAALGVFVVRVAPENGPDVVDFQLRPCEASFTGTPPVRQIERASGVSEVDVDGQIVRCLVTGSFQPFLEALRGHEVITLQATPAASTRVKEDH